MSVITVDRLVEGVGRQDVLDWLAAPGHHDPLLRAAFSDVRPLGDGGFVARLDLPTPVSIEYRFREVDERHGGRRVLVSLGGKRTRGELHYSLRTMKPSTNTLVTLHADYTSGRVLGPLLDAAFVRKALEAGMKKMLDALDAQLPRSAKG